MSDEDRLAASRDALGALRGKAIQDALTDQAMASIAAEGHLVMVSSPLNLESRIVFLHLRPLEIKRGRMR